MRFPIEDLNEPLLMLEQYGNKPFLASKEFRDFCLDSYRDEMACESASANEFLRMCIEVWMDLNPADNVISIS